MSGRFLWGKHERGDTIVEVMISLIVISSILVGAFLVARTSSRNIRSSEEHSQALNLLQGQVELLRTYAIAEPAKTPKLPTTNGTPFCMKDDGTYTPAACTIPNSAVNSSYNYTLTVKQIKPANTDPTSRIAATYEFSIKWPAQNGTTSNESFLYRPEFK
jgi:Tfp pilus assembly protein PilV